MYSKVYIEITNICNMRCSFCHGHKRAPRQMSREEFVRILDQLRGQTKYIYYHLMGEPLTHPHLPEFMRLAGEYGYKSVITTNGTLLDRRGEELLAAGLHKINLSLHSFEEGSDEAHASYVRALADFARRAAEAGTIVVFRLWNRGHDGDKNAAAEAILREEIPGEWVLSPRSMRIREKIFLEWGERFSWPDMSADVMRDRFFCYGLKNQFGILADGTVVPCCLDSEGIISLGNIFKEDIEDILSSERARAMVRGVDCGHASEELCKRCGYARRFV